MRALLFLVAGLVLAACTSSPVPSSNPQIASGANRWIQPTSSVGRLRLVFENKDFYRRFHVEIEMYAVPLKCIERVDPRDLILYQDEPRPLEIQADTKCGTDRAEVDYLVEINYDRIRWLGVFAIWYDPRENLWVGVLKRGLGSNFALCTHPGRVLTLHDGEHIVFRPCPHPRSDIGLSR